MIVARRMGLRTIFQCVRSVCRGLWYNGASFRYVGSLPVFQDAAAVVYRILMESLGGL